MVDQFTKWIECIPLPQQTADLVVKAVVDWLIICKDINSMGTCPVLFSSYCKSAKAGQPIPPRFQRPGRAV